MPDSEKNYDLEKNYDFARPLISWHRGQTKFHLGKASVDDAFQAILNEVLGKGVAEYQAQQDPAPADEDYRNRMQVVGDLEKRVLSAMERLKEQMHSSFVEGYLKG